MPSLTSPHLLHALIWTLSLTLAVAIASITPELAFVFAISQESEFSRVCDSGEFVRVPVDVAREVVCLPVRLFAKSAMDFAVPPIFAAVVVAGGACVVRAVGI
ncbi:hypothetical protein Droror1_Dr00008681 [Drosera rotundifolia]